MSSTVPPSADDSVAASQPVAAAEPCIVPAPLAPEVGGRKGPEPTRYGDWEKNGRCIDF